MKKTNKHTYALPYEIHHWGWIEVEETTYYKAMEKGWDVIYGSFMVPEGGSVRGSEITLDETWTPPDEWENPDATCYEEIDETPPKQIKLFDDEEEEVV